jgi:hypothetical protein
VKVTRNIVMRLMERSTGKDLFLARGKKIDENGLYYKEHTGSSSKWALE